MLAGTTLAWGQAQITVVKSCAISFNQAAQNFDVSLAATLTNTGTETVNSIFCGDVPAASLTGVPSTLAPGASAVIHGTYPQAGPSASDTLTCQGVGAISGTPLSTSSSASCQVTTNPAIGVVKSCAISFNQATRNFDVSLAATLTNTGTETVNSIFCGDVPAASLTGVPSTLAPGASAVIHGTYPQAGPSASDTLTCQGVGAISGTPLSTSSSASCQVTTPTVTIATNQPAYLGGDRMIITVTTTPGAAPNESWYLMVTLVTPVNTLVNPLFIYRFDPVVELITLQDALARPSINDIAARPLQPVKAESLAILDLILPPSLPVGAYTSIAFLISQDLQRISNVAAASFTVPMTSK